VDFTTAWRRNTENHKVVLYKNRWTASLYCFLHLPPISIALAIMALNFMGTRVGTTVDPTWSTGLQFCAKLHEVLMQTSLAAIVLSFIRSELLRDSLPLGTVFAPVQTTFISYLWSLEFWSGFSRDRVRDPRKLLLLLSIFGTLVLSVLVGPSSAVAMIPRNINQTVSVTYFSDQPPLYPQSIGARHEPVE